MDWINKPLGLLLVIKFLRCRSKEQIYKTARQCLRRCGEIW